MQLMINKKIAKSASVAAPQGHFSREQAFVLFGVFKEGILHEDGLLPIVSNTPVLRCTRYDINVFVTNR